MPLYTYTNLRTGTRSVRMVAVADRDRQPGLKRVPEFATGRLGLAEDPYTQAYGVRQGLRDMEERYGTGEMQRQLGADLNLKHVKQTWGEN